MLKLWIFNSPQASKINCQRQTSIYRCTNCLQSLIYLSHRHLTCRLTGRWTGDVKTIITKSKHERLSRLSSTGVQFDLSLPRMMPWAVDLNRLLLRAHTHSFRVLQNVIYPSLGLIKRSQLHSQFRWLPVCASKSEWTKITPCTLVFKSLQMMHVHWPTATDYWQLNNTTSNSLRY